ncbi:MAG: sugar transferase [Chloroflexi bacterium]|nr:sugar transferase [Chloroflexota bacterium]
MPFSPRFAERRTHLIAVDLVLVILTTLLALWIAATRGGRTFDQAYLFDESEWFFWLSGLWLFSAFLNNFYDPRKIGDLGAAMRALLRAIILITFVYIAIYFFAPTGSLPRGIVGYQGASSFVLIGLWRALYVSLIRRPTFSRKVIIVGAGWAGQTIAETIAKEAQGQYQILGFADDDPAKLQVTGRKSQVTSHKPQVAGRGPALSGVEGSQVAKGDSGYTPQPETGDLRPGTWDLGPGTWDLPILGGSRDLLRLVNEERVPEVILAISHDLSTTLFQALLDCKVQGVQITLMPVLFEQLTGQVSIEHIGDNWNVALPLDSAEAGSFYSIAKRLFDICGALVGLLLFSALLPLIVLAIRLDSAGPIFYTQERVGKGGRVFKLLKLRTMVVDAEADGHARHATTNDPRVTRVGRWLRKMRLDEMPQLVNILKGDMSAVGPRPERPEHLAEFDELIPFHRLRNAVKPGMAGWAVVNYDYVDSIDDARIRLQYDLYYIKHQSFWLDIVILLRTMGHMLMLRGR